MDTLYVLISTRILHIKQSFHALLPTGKPRHRAVERLSQCVPVGKSWRQNFYPGDLAPELVLDRQFSILLSVPILPTDYNALLSENPAANFPFPQMRG